MSRKGGGVRGEAEKPGRRRGSKGAVQSDPTRSGQASTRCKREGHQRGAPAWQKSRKDERGAWSLAPPPPLAEPPASPPRSAPSRAWCRRCKCGSPPPPPPSPCESTFAENTLGGASCECSKNKRQSSVAEGDERRMTGSEQREAATGANADCIVCMDERNEAWVRRIGATELWARGETQVEGRTCRHSKEARSVKSKQMIAARAPRQ